MGQPELPRRPSRDIRVTPYELLRTGDLPCAPDTPVKLACRSPADSKDALDVWCRFASAA